MVGMMEAGTNLDVRTRNRARMYVWLGGKDNFAVDRMAEEITEILTGRSATLRQNQAFVQRAVRYLAAEARIRQFIDVGTGPPTAENVHQVAQAAAPRGPRRVNGHRP
jgi:hypothetical protein